MARRTLGAAGSRAASGTYLFLHYALLVACAPLLAAQAFMHMSKRLLMLQFPPYFRAAAICDGCSAVQRCQGLPQL